MAASMLIEAGITRSDLPLFHEMPLEEQTSLWQIAQPHFEKEIAYFDEHDRYTDLGAAASGVKLGLLVPVIPKSGHYGIVSPIRHRYDLGRNLPNNQASVPFLHREAEAVLNHIGEDFYSLSRRDDEFRERLQHEGFSAVRLSLCSLLRTTQYQRFIAQQGRFALGRDQDGRDRPSSHEKARALDIDHAGFYAVRSATGQEVGLNRQSNDKDFAAFGRLLPRFKFLLREVIEVYQADGTVMAIEEVPAGWGCWHIAVKAA